MHSHKYKCQSFWSHGEYRKRVYERGTLGMWMWKCREREESEMEEVSEMKVHYMYMWICHTKPTTLHDIYFCY